MKAIHVRNVPPDMLNSLKRRAAAGGRSLQKEVLEILARAAREAPEPVRPGPIRLILAQGPSRGTWRREEIYGDGV